VPDLPIIDQKDLLPVEIGQVEIGVLVRRNRSAVKEK
jgi:hypothetical protein